MTEEEREGERERDEERGIDRNREREKRAKKRKSYFSELSLNKTHSTPRQSSYKLCQYFYSNLNYLRLFPGTRY